MSLSSAPNAVRDQRVFRALSYTLVFLMMACAAMTLGALISNMSPGWHSRIITSVLLLVVIDRLYTYRHSKTLTLFSSEWFMAMGAQWLLVGLLTRFLLSYADGLESFKTDLSLFTRGYMAHLFTPEFVVTLLLAVLVWFLSAQFLGLLDEIGLDEQLAWQEESIPTQRELVPAHQRLVNLILVLGIALVILTVLSRLNLRNIFSNLEKSPFSAAEAGVLLYFVFGLSLLSLSRLMSLQTHWHRQRIPISSKHLMRQWGIYSLTFLLILAVVVSLLPAGDNLGFLSLLRTLFGFLVSILFFVGQLILLLLALLFSLPLLLLRGDSAPEDLPALPPFPTIPEEPAASAGNEIWMLIRSLLLWGLLLGMTIFALRHFVRQHEGLAVTLRRSRIINWLNLAWQWLYRNVDRARGSLSHAIVDGWHSVVSRLERKRILPPVSMISIRSLDPRRRVYFFYLTMVRRAGEQGLARRSSQTPSEYADTLEKALPSASEDIGSLTEAFTEARYSRQEVEASKADIVKATWGRIRRVLQNKSKGEQSANH